MVSDKQKIADLFAVVLEQEAAAQEEFLRAECGDDISLREEVGKLLHAFRSPQMAEFLSAPAAAAAAAAAFECAADYFAADEEPDAWIGETVGHYKIIERIGAGGMGAIYLAERSDNEGIRQRVAVKILKRGMDTEAILRRFRHERQILANLEHPFIARFLDAGTTLDGLPFFVMELVEGLPIDEYCRAGNLNEAERLELFRKVCQAVSFAHQKLTIHRDLKPSNILVAANSTPKLLDFGIAKLLDSTEEETQTNMRVLTPAYASPEQIRGEIVGTASDVYSLGLILADMLEVQDSKQIPKSNAQSLNQDSDADSKNKDQRSKTKDRNLNQDLQNILAKSLREDMTRRYQSVEQFSEDVRRYLAGLPVTARKDSFSYRASKFVQRNRFGVTVITSLFLLLVGGVAGIFWQYRKAQIAQGQAERRFNEVRRLANSLVFEINDEIESGPTKARQKLVAKGLEYLDSLAREDQTDSTLKRELAGTYLKIGDIQGRAGHANLGDSAGALKSYQKAIDILEKLLENEPQSQETLAALGIAYENVGKIQMRGNEFSVAVETHEKALKIRQDLLRAAPENLEYRRFMAESLVRIGDSLSRIADLTGNIESYPKFLENYQKAEETFDEIALRDPAKPAYQTWQPVIRQRIGTLLDRWGKITGDAEKLRSAVEAHRQSLMFWQSLSEKQPENDGLRNQIAGEMIFTGISKTNLGELNEAFANFRQAKSILEALAAKDKENKEIFYDFIFFYQSLAAALVRQGNISEALKTHLRILQIAEKLQVENPNRTAENYSAFLASYHAAGELYEKQNNLPKALENSRREYEIRAKVLETAPFKAKLLGEQAATAERIEKLSARY